MSEQTIPCRKAFTDTLLELAIKDPSIVVVTSDARGSVTLEAFAKTLPRQFMEVGIAEQDAVGVAAGLASCGKKAFVCSPACFLSARSLEQVKIDVAYAHTNVKLFGVSGGVSYGALGASHHSLQDIAVMRAIPGIAVVLPSDRHLTEAMTRKLAQYDGPVYIRVGRGAVRDVYTQGNAPFELGKANTLLYGEDIAIVAAGETVRAALDAGLLLKEQGFNAWVLDMHTVKPLDTDAVLEAAGKTGAVLTVEEHSIHGGLGEAVCRTVAENCPTRVRVLGIPDENTITGTSGQIFAYYGLTAENLAQTALEMIRNK